MTISYNWLCDYLPEAIEPEKLSKILTSIGLEVESLEKYEELKGGLKGLVIGEVMECEKHPNADKLSITKVNIGTVDELQIVCGASNVAVGQKVIVATVGTTIYPKNGDALTMRVAKIRSIESFGMICAEDEIGLSDNHDGIMVLPNNVVVGTNASDYFKPYEDWIFEIGLTPNRMDAQSHLGVAKDVCAYLTHHNKTVLKPKYFSSNNLKLAISDAQVSVEVKDNNSCLRYTGLSIQGVTVAESPKWLKDRLQSIGVKSINNIVDITNYILNESGQPLHAFDQNKIADNKVIVTCLEEGASFVTLDEQKRNLKSTDLMICDGSEKPMCIAGVYGGLSSGVTKSTTNIFLESACFNATSIRKTSLHHQLRTDAAIRFEKGIDISNCINVLKRAALLIIELAGGNIVGEIIDVYPNPIEKKNVTLKYHYLKKLSGKNYHPDSVKKILEALNFEILREGIDEIQIAVPHSKTDISIPADLVEEIIRIDGLDNIEIPKSIQLSPAINELNKQEKLKEKISSFLVGQGFNEIITNSITNSKYYSEEELNTTVKMLNSLTVELDIMRPTLLDTGLETISFNLNRKNNNLQLFELGNSYHQKEIGDYVENQHIALFFTGNTFENEWKEKSNSNDYYRAKGMITALLNLCGINNFTFEQNKENLEKITILSSKKTIAEIVLVTKNKLSKFDIKQPVVFIDLDFSELLKQITSNKIVYKEVNKFPTVQRDLALIVDRNLKYETIESSISKLKLSKLTKTTLFDVFVSDKLGENKKSMAINFIFSDDEKTLTDKEIDSMMNTLIKTFEKDINADIRKSN